MNVLSKHIVSFCMLLLVLVYSTPITSLHNCSNLNHQHQELTLEESHPHCYLCDLQIQPYTPEQFCIQSEPEPARLAYSQSTPVPGQCAFRPVLSDRGPPILG